jgi:hypothetical protein
MEGSAAKGNKQVGLLPVQHPMELKRRGALIEFGEGSTFVAKPVEDPILHPERGKPRMAKLGAHAIKINAQALRRIKPLVPRQLPDAGVKPLGGKRREAN